MAINWVKVEEKPEKKQAIEGRVLLDLRSKINDLELKVTQLTNDLDESKEKLRNTQQKLDETSEALSGTEKKIKG